MSLPNSLIKEVPQGLQYFPKFLTDSEGKKLYDELVASSKWTGVSAHENSLQVIQYGYTYYYTGGSLLPTDPIPQSYSDLLATKLGDPEWGSLVEFVVDRPDQLIINRYLPGQGISPHIDHLINFGDVIICVTLGSGATIKFTRAGYETYSIYVEPNSIYIMSDESRVQWKHSIDANKTDLVNHRKIKRDTRISLTFRTINQNVVG
jgi:alkylated DNA repair dioxygenase AlkB